MGAGGGSLFASPGDRDPEAILRRLTAIVRELAQDGFTDFLCGMAEGFDLMAGEAVLSLREEFPQLRLTAVIPFPGQADGFAAATRELYERVLSAADEKITVCPQYSADCFHRRNDYLVYNASALVCYYNGSKGGTQYTVRRALRNGLRVINLV